MLSGVNIHVVELEEKLANLLNVDHVIALSSCTSGMILALQAAGLRSKEILIPSFSFSATAHMAYWNNSPVKFVDCDPNTFNISFDDLKHRISDQSKAILAVNMYGNPCDLDILTDFCEDKNLSLLFDSAHAIGSKYKNNPIGSQGLANSFSCSPTKLFTTIEGGFVTTNDEKMAEKVRIGRNYGNYPDYTCDSPGLSARMSEIQAAIGIVSLPDIPTFVNNRNRYVKLYNEELKSLPGMNFQKITADSISSYKDYSILIDSTAFGMDRNILAAALNAENIQTKFYFFPPIHQLKAFSTVNQYDLPETTKISNTVLSLPIHNFMKEEDIKRITGCIESIHENAETINILQKPH